MAEPPPCEPRRRSSQGIALVVVGLLFLIPSGLCSTILGADIVAGTSQGAQYPSGLIGLVPVMGGPPMALGAVLFWLGLRRRRRTIPPVR